MPQLPDLSRPIMRRAASLNANQTRREGLEERQYFRPLQLPTQYCLASCIDPVQLEDPLEDVQTDCGNLHGGRLLQLVALNGPSLAQRCHQGSSTASDFIHQLGGTGGVAEEMCLTRPVATASVLCLGIAGIPACEPLWHLKKQ